MADADLGKFVVPELPLREFSRGISVLDQDWDALGTDRVNLFLHEAGDGGEIATCLKFEKPAPERSHGSPGECGQVINGRDTKLVHRVQQLDVMSEWDWTKAELALMQELAALRA
ncbi:MAG TPA: hypothetical protein VFC39_14835 [Acidobacteriaceae bacterium]|nr:hypothetical protein [Acidobacteriaceae bacterium]